MPSSGVERTSGRLSVGSAAPVSERQQLALLLQMTSPKSDQGLKMNSKGRHRNERGETPLHIASIKGDQEQVRLLLERGADPNVPDFAGWTPLHEACNHGWLDVARLLLQAGADVNARGLDDDTPLHDAAINSHSKLVMLLIDHGADIHQKNKRGKTPQDVAGVDLTRFLPSWHASVDNNKTAPRVTLRLHQLKARDEKKDRSKGNNETDNHENSVTNESGNGKSTSHISSPPTDEMTTKEREVTSVNPSSSNNSGGGSEKAEKPEGSSEGNKEAECVTAATVAESLGEEGREKRHSTEDDEEVKRKKRKEDTPVKGKTGSNSGGSPKSAMGDSDTEENKNVESPGPKVPPLKIVIPSSVETEQGIRNGKSGVARHHTALPYVVATTSPPPADTTATTTTTTTTSPPPVPGSTLDVEMTEEQRSHQRVLRSSHSRSGGSSGAPSGSSSPVAPENPSPGNLSPTPSSLDPVPPPAEPPAEDKPPEPADSTPSSVELHPRKRKLKPRDSESSDTTSSSQPVSCSQPDQTVPNCYQLFLNIRKQIDNKRKGLFPVQPKPPQGFKDYLMNRCTYVLAGNASSRLPVAPPSSLQGPMKELFQDQEKERFRLRTQHVIEKEKLVLSVEQEILRVHGRAARALANQALPFSACTILRDEEVYSAITPEQEEKDRNARSRYNGRLFLSWLQDVDDKWEKIKESMLLRHHNEAESLYAVQKMDWEWKMKELGLCEFKAKPVIEESHVPMVHVSDDFDLLPG